MTITASADGSALGNPGPAGWAWYVNDDCWDAGGWKHATNNQGELRAVLELFRATAHLDDDLHILCDSQYVINSLTKWMPGWKKKGWRKGDGKPVLNVDLMQELDAALAGRRYRFEWVKGHIGHVLNEAADARARAAAESYQRGVVPAPGPGFRMPGLPLSAPEPTTIPERVEGAISAPEAVEGPPDQDTLFSFDEPALHEFTLSLTDHELSRLKQRASAKGVPVEEFLRSLI